MLATNALMQAIPEPRPRDYLRRKKQNRNIYQLKEYR